MESLRTSVKWLHPVRNVRATAPSGEAIDVASCGGYTAPQEDLILGVRDSERYLYHYTSSRTAKKILANLTLRMGDLRGTNDPKESKEWHFDLTSTAGSDLDAWDKSKLAEELSLTIKKHARVLCFCKDGDSLSGNHVDDVARRGHMRARMWAQYGENHAGVCLALDKKLLLEQVRAESERVISLWARDILYWDRGILDGQHERDYLIDVDVLRQVGFEQYWKLHAKQFYQRLFFEKRLDWKDEREYRILALLDRPREVFIDIRGCLRAVFFGDTAKISDFESTIDELMAIGVQVMGLSWSNCCPWYDFANPIFNAEMRAIAKEVETRGDNGSAET